MLSLKGPKGDVVDIAASSDVKNFDQIKVFRQGDQVDVTYTEALALNLGPAPKPPAKKAVTASH
jgi:hypothetical protein